MSDVIGNRVGINLEEVHALSPVEVDQIVRDAVHDAGGMVHGYLWVPYQPQGDTYIWAISMSHVVIHTWPEKRVLAVDVFSCQSDGHDLIDRIVAKILHGKSVKCQYR